MKTHKSTEIARRQLELGATGLTCQTLGEAETMADAGCHDLSCRRTWSASSSSHGSRGCSSARAVTVAVDDARILPGLADAGTRSGQPLRVLIECDTGNGRLGVSTPRRRRRSPATSTALPRSSSPGSSPIPHPAGAVEFLAAAVEHAERQGLSVETVSAGGTPAMWSADALRPTVTEYRAGTYVYHDRNTVAAGAATLDDVALTVYATVIGRPARNRAILDAGSKSLSSDRSPAEGFGLVLEAPESTLVRVDEEHGYLELASGDELELGQQVRIVPNHACVVSNLFAEVALVRDGELAGRWPVDARSR